MVGNSAASVSAMMSRRVLTQGTMRGRGDGGGGGAGDAMDVANYPLPREALLRNIKRFQARDKYCWALPLTCFGFTLWCLGLALHSNVEASNSVEAGLNSLMSVMGYTDGSATVPYDTASFYDFLGSQVVDVVVPDDSGVVNRYGRLLGGVRVSQTRSQAAAGCAGSPYADVITAVVGDTTCFPYESESSEPFGDPAAMVADVEMPGEFVALCTGVTVDSDPSTAEWEVPLPDGASTVDGDPLAICNATGVAVSVSAVANATRVVHVNVTSAFLPRPPAGLLGGQNPYLATSTVATAPDRRLPNVNDPFSWTFDYYSRSARQSLDALAAAGWVDDATKRVTVLFAVVNLELGFWGRVLITSSFTRGGRVMSTAGVRSVPIDPYAGQQGLGFLDFLIAAYVAVYWVQTLQHLLKRLRRARRAVSEGRGWGAAAAQLTDPWLVLDVGTGVGFVVTLALWARAAATLAYLRAGVTGSSWDPAGVADSTFVAHAWIEAAARDFYDFKVLGVATLALFMCRLFWQFSLQPKLAVMSETLSRGCSDIAHFVVLFAVMLVFYGVWGHIFFGGQIDRWRSPWESCWAVIAWLAYEYDLTYMQAVDNENAKVFFGSFMFLVTNLILWMFFAIVFEYYSEVRMEVSKMPSAWEDLVEGGRALPNKLTRVSASLRRGAAKVGCARAGGGGRGGVMSSARRDDDGGGSGRPGRAGRIDGGGAGGIHKVSARRVAELLASDAFAEREFVTVGDIAASLRRTLPDVVSFLARFIELPEGLEVLAAEQEATGQRTARATVGAGGGKFSFGGMMSSSSSGGGGGGGGTPSRPTGGAAGSVDGGGSFDGGDDDGVGSFTGSLGGGSRKGSSASWTDAAGGTVMRPPTVSRAAGMASQPMTAPRAALNPMQAAARRPTSSRAAGVADDASGGLNDEQAQPPPAAAASVAIAVPPAASPPATSDEEDAQLRASPPPPPPVGAGAASPGDDSSRRGSTASPPTLPPAAPAPLPPPKPVAVSHGGGQKQSWALYGNPSGAVAPPTAARRPPSAPARPR